MAATYEFKIATEGGGVGGLTNVEDMSPALPPPFSGMLEYPEIYTDGDGQRQGDGDPQVTWTWTGGLTQAQYNQLRTYCSGQSATVYIRTKKDDGTYGNYKAILNWPDRPGQYKVSGNFYERFEVLFTRLELQ